MKFIALVCMILLIATVAIADQKAVQKYRNYTPQQIKEIPEKVRSSEVPMIYTFAAQRGLSVGSDLLFGMELNRLMYPGIHDYKAAVKAFQTDIGDEPTGTLTVWQIHTLELRSEMQKLNRVLFSDQFFSMKTDDYARIEGTMIIVDENIASPVNHVTVKCFREQQYCQLDQIQISVPDDKSWSQNYHVMQDKTEYYTISRWGQDTIDAEPKEVSDACRNTSASYNFKTKEFYFITRNAGGDCEVLGVKLEKLSKPRISQIVDGSEIIASEFAIVEKNAYDVLSSDFRKRVDKLSTQEQKNESRLPE